MSWQWNYEPVSYNETDGLPTSLRHCSFNGWLQCNMYTVWYDTCSMMFFDHWRVSMVVADVLVPIWHQDICNHHDDVRHIDASLDSPTLWFFRGGRNKTKFLSVKKQKQTVFDCIWDEYRQYTSPRLHCLHWRSADGLAPPSRAPGFKST